MKINQVLWILSSETKNIVPVMIVEKITKETSQGQKVEFVVELTSGKRKNLSEIKDNFFESSEEARQHLLQIVTNMVDDIVSRAVQVSKKFDHSSPTAQQLDVQPVEEHDTMSLHSEERIVLPDGRTAKVNFKVPQA